MTTPPVPPPPTYAPTAGMPTTWWTVPERQPEAPAPQLDPEPEFVPEDETEQDSPHRGVPFRLGYNALCVALGAVPSPDTVSLLGGWRTALHQCAVQASPAGALGLAGMGVGLAVLLDHYRGGWLWRTVLWAIGLGSITTAAVFLGVVQLLTGAV